MKVCAKCKEIKELSEFGKAKENKGGLQGACKRCQSIHKIKHNRTKEGKFKFIYLTQIKHSKTRGHELPCYTKKEFIDRFINDKKYLLLHSNWVSSDYLTELSPSFDRLNDYKPYSFDNLQLMTWQENKNKYYLDAKNGVNNKQSKAVIGTHIETSDTIEFYSMQEAERNGFNHGAISTCCLGKAKQHKGYKWVYK